MDRQYRVIPSQLSIMYHQSPFSSILLQSTNILAPLQTPTLGQRNLNHHLTKEKKKKNQSQPFITPRSGEAIAELKASSSSSLVLSKVH